MISRVEMPETLPAVLNALHDQHGKQCQTIRGGTQVGLDGCPHKAVSKLLRGIGEKLDGMMEGWKYSGVWTIRMNKGGFHVGHNHPDGLMSGVYYVQTGLGGDLQLGDKLIKPEPETLIVFPSTTPHGTTVYVGDEPRITVAFDVVKQ